MNDSSLGRLLGVLLSPGETFRSIEGGPRGPCRCCCSAAGWGVGASS